MRTGVQDKSWNAHSLVPLLRQWGVAMVTVHGRSREQRYTKLANYDYINRCAAAAAPMPLYGGRSREGRGGAGRERAERGEAGREGIGRKGEGWGEGEDEYEWCSSPPWLTLVTAGNGDILSFEDYNLRLSSTNASGLMIGRLGGEPCHISVRRGPVSLCPSPQGSTDQTMDIH